MHTRFIPRFLFAGLMLALFFVGSNRSSTFAAERIDWKETKSQEDVLVQSCSGFNVTGSYVANLSHHIIADNTGDEVSEQVNVDFSGAIGNAESGKSYAYSGQFTRWDNYLRNRVTFTDLQLRFEVGTPGEFTIDVKRIALDLEADPHAVLKSFVPNALQMDLCQLFGGSTIGHGPITPSSHPSAANADYAGEPLLPEQENFELSFPPEYNGYAGSSVLPDQDDDSMTPWTELDPCDSSLPGRPC